MPRLRSRRRSSGRLSAPVDVDSINKIPKFESLIGPVLVFVYADWCGHCQRYKPLWKELENDPNRSLNMAAVRDDMVSNTSLTQRAAPISSYPTVMLIGENGKAVNFKGPNAPDSQNVPDHTNMETMRAIVRNAGTPNGTQILSENSINESINQSINNTQTGPSVSPPNIAADMILSTEKKTIGGSLFNVLLRTAYSGPSHTKKQRRSRSKKTRAKKIKTTRRHR